MTADSPAPESVPDEAAALVKLPPKMVRRHIEDVERGVLSPGPGEPGSLPVLEAFQEYLEAERRQNKGRLWALTFFYTAILFTVLGGGYVMNEMSMKRVDGDMGVLGRDIEVLGESALTTLGLISNVHARLQSQDVLFREAVKQDRDRLGSVKGELASIQSTYEDQLKALTAKLATLEGKSAELAQNVDLMDDRLHDATNQIAQAVLPSVALAPMPMDPSELEMRFPTSDAEPVFLPSEFLGAAKTPSKPEASLRAVPLMAGGIRYRLGLSLEGPVEAVEPVVAEAPARPRLPLVPRIDPTAPRSASDAPVFFVDPSERFLPAAPVVESGLPVRSTDLPMVGRTIEPLPELDSDAIDALLEFPTALPESAVEVPEASESGSDASTESEDEGDVPDPLDAGLTGPRVRLPELILE